MQGVNNSRYKNMTMKKKELKTESQRFKKNLMESLEKQGEVTIKDKAAIDVLVNTYNMYLTTLDKVNEDGVVINATNGNGFVTERQNPYLSVLLTLQSSLVTLLKEFALTPKSKKAIKAEDGEDDNPFTAMQKDLNK